MQGVITGYNIDAEGIGALVDLGLSDEQIHKVVEGVFEREYSQRLTQNLIDRVRDKKENGADYRGLGSLIYLLKQVESDDAKGLLRLIDSRALFNPFKPIQEVRGFYVDLEEKFLYKEVKQEYVQVGPYIKPVTVLRGNKAYLIYEHEGQTHKASFGDKKRLIEEIQNTTGGLIVRERDFLEFLGLYDKAHSIKKLKLQDHVGWDEDGERYFLPQLISEGLVFDDALSGFSSAGSKDEELGLMKKVFKEGEYLMLGYVFGFSAPLVNILDTGNFVVFLEGEAGKGKSTTNYIALSLYGNYRKLKLTMNMTENAFEVVLKQRRDTYICFDEVNTGAKDIAMQLVKAVYSVEAGTGRGRLRLDITLREMARYRGIVGITSEESFSSFMNAVGRTVRGAQRRTVLVDFSAFDRKVDNSLFYGVYEGIRKNYGGLIGDWIAYINKRKDEIERAYLLWLDTLKDEDRGYKFVGQERYLALLFTTAEKVCEVFGLGTDAQDRVLDYLWKVCEANDEAQREVSKVYERDGLRELIIEFVEAHYNNFEWMRTRTTEKGNLIEYTSQEAKASALYGLVKAYEGHLYLTSLGYKALSNYLKVQQKVLSKLLIEFGFAEPSQEGANQLVKRTKIFFSSGAKLNAYRLRIDDLPWLGTGGASNDAKPSDGGDDDEYLEELFENF
jgi:hypothetical protein